MRDWKDPTWPTCEKAQREAAEAKAFRVIAALLDDQEDEATTFARIVRVVQDVRKAGA